MTQPADLIYRAATPDDAPVLARLQLRAWAEAYRDMMPAHHLQETSLESRTQAWRIAITRHADATDEGVIVVDRGDLIVAFGTFAPQRRSVLAAQGYGHEIGALVVRGKAQRTGIGRAVLRQVFACVSGAGGSAASIRVTRSNDKGRDFVEGTGAEMLDNGLGNSAHVLEEITYGWHALRLMQRPVDLRSLTRPHDPDCVTPPLQ